MPARAKLAESEQMTVEEFLAYMESRPDGERWELIDGVAIMNASPTDWHQVITGNINTWLSNHKVETNAKWTPLPGVGTIVPISPMSLPQPDVFVKEHPAEGSPVTADALILFEILSRSNTKRDQAWRRRVYASIPNCQHYITVSTKVAEITRYDRANGWIATTAKGLGVKLVLPAIDAEIPLRNIYRWTPIE